jgi:hypothetical protein
LLFFASGDGDGDGDGEALKKERAKKPPRLHLVSSLFPQSAGSAPCHWSIRPRPPPSSMSSRGRYSSDRSWQPPPHHAQPRHRPPLSGKGAASAIAAAAALSSTPRSSAPASKMFGNGVNNNNVVAAPSRREISAVVHVEDEEDEPDYQQELELLHPSAQLSVELPFKGNGNKFQVRWFICKALNFCPKMRFLAFESRVYQTDVIGHSSCVRRAITKETTSLLSNAKARFVNFGHSLCH